MRPLSMIAIRSCSHSSGLPAATWGSRKPAQPASRGLAANNSDKVGLGGAGNDQRTPSPGTPGGDPGAGDLAARLPSPATRDKPCATRLTTFLFCFCSLSRDSPAGVNMATRKDFQAGETVVAEATRAGSETG